jgi:hypothetical protein
LLVGTQIMFKWGKPEEGQSGRADGPQFCLGGDTWVIGCRIPDSAVCEYQRTSSPACFTCGGANARSCGYAQGSS